MNHFKQLPLDFRPDAASFDDADAELCDRCGRERNIFTDDGAKCVRCDAVEMFGHVAAHRQRTAAIAKAVGHE